MSYYCDAQNKPISRAKFVKAQALKGAMFGAKWMAIILGALLILTWIFMLGVILFVWFQRGEVTWRTIDTIKIFMAFGGSIVCLLYSTFVAGVLGGIIAGVFALFGLRCKRKEEPKTA